MKKETFLVKEKSLQEFLNVKSDPRDTRNEFLPYDHMRDELVVPKGHIPEGLNSVIVELLDRAHGSRRNLKNTYTYNVEEYDSLQFKLRLVDFKVQLLDSI